MTNTNQQALLKMMELAEKGIFLNTFTKEFWTGTALDCKEAVKQYANANKSFIDAA